MRRFIIFTATALFMASAFGAGEVYRWRGPDGTWHYSDQPRPGAQLVVGSQGQLTTEPTPAPAAEAPADPPVDNTNLPVSDRVANEVRAAVAAARTEQCKKAETAYQEAVVARRGTKVDANGKPQTDAQGNPVFMTSAELDAERLKRRALRDEACGS